MTATRLGFLISVFFLVAFALSFTPLPALAMVDCEAKPNHPQCGGGGGEPTPQVLVLRDGSGTTIGEVVDLDRDAVRVVYRGDPADSQFFADIPLAILWRVYQTETSPNPFWLSEPSVFFESTDCTGAAYYQFSPDATGFAPFGIATRLNIRQLPGGGQVIYVPVDINETPAPIAVSSHVFGNSQCQTFSASQVRNVNPATTVNTNFVGPYTVGF